MPTHQSLQRANAILRQFTELEPALTVSEISRRVGIHKSTVSRILKTLLEDGMVWHNRETGRYSLGMTLVEMAGVALGQIDVRAAAMPHMEQLASETNETISVAVPRGEEALTVAHTPSTHPIRHVVWIGRRFPLLGTAAGMALLAVMNARGEPWQELVGIDPEDPSDGSMKDLEAELRLATNRGYADESNQFEVGTAAIAAPILDHTGAAVGALSVSGPSARFDPSAREMASPSLIEAAGSVAIALGGHRLNDFSTSHF
jgi:DNA-binding IclR family transcriptional regulator